MLFTCFMLRDMYPICETIVTAFAIFHVNHFLYLFSSNTMLCCGGLHCLVLKLFSAMPYMILANGFWRMKFAGNAH